MPTITAGDFRKGMIFEMEGKPMVVVDFQHVKPGKEIGRASCRERV